MRIRKGDGTNLATSPFFHCAPERFVGKLTVRDNVCRA